jgi:hypothetical protein
MEQLLILRVPETAELRKEIARKARVVQEGSDNLLVVEGSADAVNEAAQLPGVSTADTLAADIADALSPSEQIFLKAWYDRSNRGPKKNRIGEGLSWGTKGFKAP